MNIYLIVPFPEVIEEPTALAKKLQERIQIMFGIVVEPVVIRHPGSYYKTTEFRFLWSMQTPCGRFEIGCFETAKSMIEKDAWRVYDNLSLEKYPGPRRITGKVIY